MSSKVSLKSTNDINKKGSMPLWRSILSLEPALVLHMTAAIMVFMVVQDFLLEKACRVNLDYGDQVCQALKAKSSGDLYASQEKSVQKLISSVMVWRTLLENCFPLFLVFLIGAWSDKYGRKLPLLLVISAFLLQDLLLILCVIFEKATGAWTVAVVSSLVISLSGNQACFMVAAFSYVADNSDQETKTMRTSITHTCIFLGVTLGLFGGGLLSHSGLPWEKCFMIGVGMEAVAFLYLFVMMKNQPKKGAGKGKSSFQIFLELFDFRHIRDSWSTVLKRREGSTRTKLWLLLLSHACNMIPMMGEMGVTYLFCRLQFSWDGATYGFWTTYKMVLGFISNFVSMAIFANVLKLSDPANGIVACVGNITAAILFALASSSTKFLMYLAPLATLVSGAAMIVPRATISKIVPPEEVGKINSFIGSMESIIPFLGSSLYTAVYTRFLDTLPGSFFLITGALMIPPMLIYWWLITQEKAVKKKDKKSQ